MAYFDDPAHREGWEQAMVGLRAERERRLSGAEPAAVASARDFGGRAQSVERIPISFKQIQEEYQLERVGKAISALSAEKQLHAPPPERAIEGPELLKRGPQG